jgi:quercetin dioxygenase-like cupin family protein
MGENLISGDGWAVATIDDLGDGPGFRKVRGALGVTEFGVNAIVLPEGHQTGRHFHDRQQELYFVHRGEIEFAFGDGTVHRLPTGGFARVDAETVRSLRNVGEGEAIYVCVGGQGGYVERDGHTADG